MVTYEKIRLSLKTLANDKLSFLCRTTLKLVSPLLADFNDDNRLKTAILKLDSDITNFEAYEQQVKKSTTEVKLSDLDKQRDRDAMDFKTYLRLQLRHRQANRRQAAETLYGLISSFGDLVRLPHTEQSAQISQLIKQLESKEYRQMLSLVGATEYFANLKDSQDKFEAAYLKKIKVSDQVALPSRAEQRKIIEDDYNNIYAYLLSLEHFGQDSYHRPLLGAFNDARKAYMDQAKKKVGQAKKE